MTTDATNATDATDATDDRYDAVLVVSFGGPEGPDDVVPFLENVTRGRGIPRERLVEVGAHYSLFGGVSPINGQCRELIAALEQHLPTTGVELPIYWGNRNWTPLLEDTVARMRDDGITHALAFVTSAYSSYSGCRQYREDIDRAVAAVGDGAPRIEKLRQFFDHPGFIDPMIDNVQHAIDSLPTAHRSTARIVFTAHSIPLSMASGSDYEAQLRAASALVVDGIDGDHGWDLVFQSRSGPPEVPWLEPDIVDHLDSVAGSRSGDHPPAVVMVPIGFISDHMEVLYDLDTEAAQRAEALGMTIRRAATVGVDPRFIAMIGELIAERIDGAKPRRLSDLAPRPNPCAANCCPAPSRPTR